MIELLIHNASGLVYVAGFAAALAVAWKVCRQFGGLRHDSSRTQARVIAVLALLAIGALFEWRMAVQADGKMRADLLQQTRLVAQDVDLKRLQSLTGTSADVNQPDYRQLKEQFAAVRSANPQCRFVYLMGRKADGTVFFFVDDRPFGHAEEAPAGVIYDDVPEGFRRVFATGLPDTAGPFTDKWGSFVSGAVPIANPDNGAVIALLGLDFDARAWKWGVAARTALPVGLMLVLLIVAAAVLAAADRPKTASPSPILWRLWPPLAGIAVLAMAGVAVLLWQQQRQRLDEKIATQNVMVSHELLVDIHNQADGLALALEGIAADPKLPGALRAGDTSLLLATWQPMFESIRREKNVTHFSFLDTNRVCLLRLHNPKRRGDRVEHFTAIETERVGKTASGIDLETVGDITLRAVRPVFVGGSLAGYVELAKDIEDLLRLRSGYPGQELALTIRKERLNQAQWVTGRREQGRNDDWDSLPRNEVTYVSQGTLSNTVAAWANPASPARRETAQEIDAYRKRWRAVSTPLRDVTGQEIGDLWVMLDLTAARADFTHRLALGGAASGVALALVLACIYVLLRRTDTGIRAQQAALRVNEELLSATLRSIGDGVIGCDADGRVVSLNVMAEKFTGWSTNEARGRPIAEVFRILHAETRQEAEIPVGRALRENCNVGMANHTVLIARNGVERQIADSCAPIHDAAGAVLGAVLVFRDVTEEHHQRDQLSASEARFDELAAQSGFITWEVDALGLYTYVSPVAESLLGYRPDEVAGCLHFYDLHPQSGREAFKKAAFEVFDRKQPFQNLLNSVQAKDGRVLWVLTNGIPLLNSDGTLRGYRGSDTDVTTQKQSETALRESETNFRAFFESMTDVIIVAATDGRIIFGNTAALRTLDRNVEEVAAMRVLEMYPADQRRQAEEIYAAILRG